MSYSGSSICCFTEIVKEREGEASIEGNQSEINGGTRNENILLKGNADEQMSQK